MGVGEKEKADVALGVDNVEEPPRVGVGVPVVPAFVGDDTTVEEGASVAVTRPGGTLVAVFGGLRVDVLGGVAVSLSLFVFVGGFPANSASNC